jgi:hypothetical protein
MADVKMARWQDSRWCERTDLNFPQALPSHTDGGLNIAARAVAATAVLALLAGVAAVACRCATHFFCSATKRSKASSASFNGRSRSAWSSATRPARVQVEDLEGTSKRKRKCRRGRAGRTGIRPDVSHDFEAQAGVDRVLGAHLLVAPLLYEVGVKWLHSLYGTEAQASAGENSSQTNYQMRTSGGSCWSTFGSFAENLNS